MQFLLTDNIVTCDGIPNTLLTGSINYYQVSVQCNNAWQGLIIKAVHINNNKCTERLVVDNKVYIDSKHSGNVFIGFIGYQIQNNVKVKQITTNLIKIPFKDGAGGIETVASDVPTPTQWEIYYQQIQNMVNSIPQQVKDITTQDISNWNSKAEINDIPTQLAELQADTTHRTVTDNQIGSWDNKSEFSGDYNDLSNKPTIPTVPANISAFNNDAGYLKDHQDISGKVDKVQGKQLSTEDFTTAEKTKLANLNIDQTYNATSQNAQSGTAVAEALNNHDKYELITTIEFTEDGILSANFSVPYKKIFLYGEPMARVSSGVNYFTFNEITHSEGVIRTVDVPTSLKTGSLDNKFFVNIDVLENMDTIRVISGCFYNQYLDLNTLRNDLVFYTHRKYQPQSAFQSIRNIKYCGAFKTGTKIYLYGVRA